MAYLFRLLLIFCIAAIYSVKPSLCKPVTATDGRGPSPHLQKLCSGNTTSSLVRSHTILCLICKGFDLSCFTNGSSTASPVSASSTSNPVTESSSTPSTGTPATTTPSAE